MSWCQRLCRYIRFWWRRPLPPTRLFDNRDSGFCICIYLFIGITVLVIMPNDFLSTTLRLYTFLVCGFIVFCFFSEWFYRKWRIIFPRMTILHANEFADPGIAWRRDRQEDPPDVYVRPSIQVRENPLGFNLQVEPRRSIVLAGNQQWFRRQEPPPFNPQPVQHRDIAQRARATDTVITRTQHRQLSRPLSSHIQAQPPVRESDWPPLNPQQPSTGFRQISPEVINMKPLSTATFRDDSHQRGNRLSSRLPSSHIQDQQPARELGLQSLNLQQPFTGFHETSPYVSNIIKSLWSRGQEIATRYLTGAKGSSELDEHSRHSNNRINYEASTSQSTEYGCPEILQGKLQTESVDESSARKSESDESNRSTLDTSKDNSSNKSSPEKNESRESEASSDQGGSNASNESSIDKRGSSSPSESSPEKDQSSASNKSSPEKSGSSESSPCSNTQSETSEKSSLQQTGSLPRRSSIMVRKSTVIKMPRSGVKLEEPNEPIKTHKSSSSKFSCKKGGSALRERLREETERPSEQKITEQAPVSETGLADAGTQKRKVSYSEEELSESEPFSTPKKKVSKVSLEKSPKSSTSREPEVYSSTRRVMIPIKRKKETSSEDEGGSSSQSEGKSSYKPLPLKIPKMTILSYYIREETDSENSD